jgi:hypothetical protein
MSAMGPLGCLAPIQRITHAADQQAVFNGVESLGAFGVARAHFMFPAIGVGKVSGLVHLSTRRLKIFG